MFKIKLFIVATFAALGILALTNFDKTVKANNEGNILSQINDYKTWKQVQKPEVKKEKETAPTDVLSISNSSAGG